MEATSPLAIVTVVRNDRAGLVATWDSLRGQSWRGFDWIVVDGASTDGTADWLVANAAAPSWWRSAPDRGLYHAMNVALERVTADAVLFLNAGDTLASPDTAARLVAALAEEPRADFLYGDAWERRHDGTLQLKPARSHRFAAFGMFTHHQAMVFRRSVVADHRFDENFAVGADYAFALITLKNSRVVRQLSLPLCVFAHGGLSSRLAREGRRDQALIRRVLLGHGPIQTGAVTTAQILAQSLRDSCPRIYALLRMRRNERSFQNKHLAVKIDT